MHTLGEYSGAGDAPNASISYRSIRWLHDMLDILAAI